MSTSPPTSTSNTGWSPGTSADSARFAKDNEELAQFGVKEALTPHSGLKFLESFSYTPDKLSNGLPTDREWSVGQASVMMVKGTVDLDVAEKALGKDGVTPVRCVVGGKEKAMASIWVNELRDSVCGAYHEYVISFDVRKSDDKVVVAFDDSAKLAAPAYACWYSNFGSDVCEAQYLHSLYIGSPLSIMWGREMQAFPKHPDPVASEMELGPAAKVKTCDVKWKDDETPLLSIRTEEKFGFLGFGKEGMGLIRHVGALAVTKFLSAAAFTTHIVVPSKTAEKYGRPRDYTANLWKGVKPTAVKVWPWDPATDKLELNATASRGTGCEEHNAVEILEKGNFQPLSVCYVAGISAVVTERKFK